MLYGPTPFPHLPLDETGGKLTADQMTTIVWHIIKEHISYEGKVNMLIDGKHAFYQKCKRSYGHLGLRQRNFRALWHCLNTEIPQVAQQLTRPS